MSVIGNKERPSPVVRFAPRTRALVLLLLVMAIWGSAFPVTKTALASVPPMTLALLRLAVATMVLLPFAARRRSQVAPLLRASWPTILAMSVLGGPLFYIASNVALVYTSASQGVMIQSIIPVVTMLLAVVVLRERPAARQIAGIALSLCGIALVVLSAAPQATAQNPAFGSLLMLGAVVCWAVYTILAKRVAEADQVVVITATMIVGTLLLVPVAGLELQRTGWPTPSLLAWVGILYLGVLSSAAANLIYSLALTHINASQAATFINLVPVIGVATAILFLGEPVIGWQMLGGLLVLVGVWRTA